MPTVTMTFFAKFCDAGINAQQRMVRDRRQQIADSKLIRSRDYYGRLREAVCRTHIGTQDVDAVRDVLVAPMLLSERMRKGQRERFQLLGDAYLEFWNRWYADAVPFAAERGHVDIAGLTVRVNPELRIHTSYGDDHVVKIWFNAPTISRSARLTMSYLMNRAKEAEGWPSAWRMGLLDVERKALLPAIDTDDNFELGLSGQAAAFLEIWRTLDAISED